MGGNEEHQRPKFFVPLADKLDVIRAKSKPLKALADKFPASRPLLDAAVAEVGMPEDELAWLPVRHLRGFWTAVIRRDDGRPVSWVDFDSYG